MIRDLSERVYCRIESLLVVIIITTAADTTNAYHHRLHRASEYLTTEILNILSFTFLKLRTFELNRVILRRNPRRRGRIYYNKAPK